VRGEWEKAGGVTLRYAQGKKPDCAGRPLLHKEEEAGETTGGVKPPLQGESERIDVEEQGGS